MGSKERKKEGRKVKGREKRKRAGGREYGVMTWHISYLLTSINMRDLVSHPSNLTASSAVLRGSEEGGDRGRERGREGVIGRTVVVVVVVVETVREDE